MADWRKDLNGFFEKTEKKRREKAEGAELIRFIHDITVPAFEDLRVELESHGREVTIRDSETSAAIIVYKKGDEEMTYRIQFRTYPDRVLPFAEIRAKERKGLRLVRFESMFRSGKPDYWISEGTREEIIRNFLEHYTRRVLGD